MKSIFLMRVDSPVFTACEQPLLLREAYGESWSSAEKGADILFDLAIDDAYDGITGKYFDNDRGSFGKAHRDAYDPSAVENLINTTRK